MDPKYMEPPIKTGVAEVRFLRPANTKRSRPPPPAGPRSKAEMQPDGTLLINKSEAAPVEKKERGKGPKPQRSLAHVSAPTSRPKKPWANVTLQACKMYEQLSRLGCGLRKQTVSTYYYIS